MSLARAAGPCFSFPLTPPPPDSSLHAPPSHCAATCAPPQPPHLATAQQPFSSAPPAQQLCAAACTRSRRRRRTTPSPPHESPSPSAAVLHAILVLRAAAPRRSHIRSTFSPSARQVLDVLPELFLSRRVRVPHTVSRRWVARRGRVRKLWSRSPLASGLVQRRRPRRPRWWPRPPRSRHQAALVRSRSGRTPEAEAEAGAWAE